MDLTRIYIADQPNPRSAAAAIVSRELHPCGTPAAYRRHQRAGETPCEDCQQARRDYVRRRYGNARPESARKPAPPCGTPAAYQRHRRYGEEACRPCKDAINALNPKSPYPPRIAECGTTSGPRRHRRLGEPVCEACRLAQNEYMRAYRARGGGNAK